MKKLYNEYLALNQDGKDLDTGAHILAKSLLEICTNNDLDLRDAESVIVSSISVMFSEAVLRRAMKMRQAEQGKESP